MTQSMSLRSDEMNTIGLGYILGVGLVAIRIIWCHFDSKKMEKWENEKIRKGIR
jgi:hypothetical protein